MADRIQIRRDTSGNWTSANPILAQGEIGFETDTVKLKIGNGIDNWNDLFYYFASINIVNLSDVDFDSGTPINNQVLKYDLTTQKWKAEKVVHSELTGIGSSDHHIKYALTDDLISGEITQLQNINNTVITNTQWGYLGSMSVQPLENILEDTTPQLGGDLDGNNKNITNVDRLEANKEINFDVEYDNGNSGASINVNWTNGNKQKITLTDNCTINLQIPSGPCNLILKLIGSASGLVNLTWTTASGSSIYWSAGTAHSSVDGFQIDIVSFYYDGNDFYGMGNSNFS